MSIRANLTAIVMAGAATMLFGVGCGASADGDTTDSDDLAIIAKDPLAMPKTILDFEKTQNWGSHHLEWHTVRRWDGLSSSDQAYAKKKGWSRADLQEGQKGNGLEFLAMHRVMIHTLTTKFPSNASLFQGWDSPPTNAKDKVDPLPGDATTPFDPAKLPAIDKLMNHLADFKTDDELGLYIETTLRPTSKDPNARSTDHSAGLHNFVHNRFMDPNSKIDIGDPSVNLQNKRFWRLHGWIESRWTAFRALKKLSDSDPAYQAAIKKAEDMLMPGAKGLPGGGLGASEPPPASLRKFFEQEGGD
ncbi:MAG: hypothetical protein ABIP39_03295 [Polyangiaceae bacterium]